MLFCGCHFVAIVGAHHTHQCDMMIPDSTLDNLSECPDFGVLQHSGQQLRLHALKAHGHIKAARQYATQLHSCPTCLRRYPTRLQVLRHMSSSTKRATYPDNVDALSDDEIQKIEADDYVRTFHEKNTEHHAPAKGLS